MEKGETMEKNRERSIRGIRDMVEKFEGVNMATTAKRLHGDLKFVLEEMGKEYKKYYSSDYAQQPSFAGTNENFKIGDAVLAGGKQYELYGFFRSVNAEDNVIDWLRLRRTNDQGVTIWRDAYPSECRIIGRKLGILTT